jgi:hypothetical protein
MPDSPIEPEGGMDPRLVAYRSPFGGRRFYPPGEHPAVARITEFRRKLAAMPSSPDRDAALAHADTCIVQFEQGESDAKARTLERLSRA